MIIFRKRFIALLFLCVAQTAFCQNVEDEDAAVESKNGYTRYLGFGAGAAYRTALDEVMSPLRYSKIGATGAITNIKTDDLKYTELYFQGSYLELNRPSDELVKSHMKALNGLMDYRHLYKLAVSFLNDGIFDVRAGGMFSTQFCYKKAENLGYSSTITEYDISLGAAAKIAKQHFISERKSYLIWEMALPFVAAYSRPVYLNQPTILTNDNNILTNAFANNSFGTFGKFFRLNSRVSVLYPVKNGNKIRFTYQWDYYRMKAVSGKSYNIEHSFIIAFLFNY